MNLENKLMLITGASSGIGAATAKLAARQGAHVILVARSQDKLEQIGDEIRSSGGQAYTYPADLTQPEAVIAMAEKINANWGHRTYCSIMPESVAGFMPMRPT